MVISMGISEMREPTFLVLTALAAGPRHGYALIADAAQVSQGRVQLRAGTLYATLDRLRDEGLVEVDHEEVVSSRLRRYHRLTPAGTAALGEAADRAQRNAEVAVRRLHEARVVAL